VKIERKALLKPASLGFYCRFWSINAEPLERYNCVMYALDPVGRMRDPLRVWSFRVDLEFLRQLVERGDLKRTNRPQPGGLVIWSRADDFKHVGILITSKRAISKWGIGLLLEHALHEVPANYGDELTFYDPVDSETKALMHEAVADN
jgi:hypothetical protein